ncbi:MAG: DUF92 domain-containing protein, partial [Sphaerochaetaceae bacterium]|nr:DUF92 domain-containing protein [Sphaerochaetaceae bacterium]
MDFINTLIFTLPWPFPLVTIFLLMVLMGIGAYYGKALNFSGTVAAVTTGTIVFYTLRLEGLFLLFLFFGGGTIIGRISKKKRQVRDKLEIEKKGNRRDWVQVFANGFMALIASLLYFTTSNSCALVMFGAAVAEATSDTCSGDIGKLSSKNPVSIRTFTPVPRGLSGGITALGIFSGFISSSVIAITWG